MHSRNEKWVRPDFQTIKHTATSVADNSLANGNRSMKKRTSDSKHCHSLDSTSLSFIQNYEPQDVEELVLNRAKLKQIENALLDAIHRKDFVLIYGPSGCGKTVTLRLLAKKLNMRIIDWKNDMTYTATNAKNNRAQILACNQCQDFFEFLRNSQKILDLELSNNATHSDHNLPGNRGFNNKIILIEEYPCMLNRSLRDFWSCLRFLKSRTLQFPLVFVFNLEEKSHFQDDNSNTANNFSRIFADNIMQELGCIRVNMNPITNANIIKLLRHLIKLSGCSLNQDYLTTRLNAIAVSSKGDARAALLTLQLDLCGDFSRNLNVPICDIPSTSRDHNVSLFSCLGKFLYSKRTDECWSFNCPGNLPNHIQSLCDTNKLAFDPEDVVSHCGLTLALFSAYLHENYINLLLNKRSANLSFLSEIATNFCLSDILSNFETKDRLNLCSTSFIGRSVALYMHFMMKGDQLNNDAMTGLGFRQIKKPSFGRELENVKDIIGNRFSVSNPNDFSLDLAPYLTVLQPSNELYRRLGRFDIKKIRNYRIPSSRPIEVTNLSTLSPVLEQTPYGLENEDWLDISEFTDDL